MLLVTNRTCDTDRDDVVLVFPAVDLALAATSKDT